MDLELMVEIKNLSKAFGDNVVLDDISLKISEGDNVVVFGRSGTGKSVLLKCIARLLEPDSGEIYVDGKNVLEMRSIDGQTAGTRRSTQHTLRTNAGGESRCDHGVTAVSWTSQRLQHQG
jgi:ABC-type transporter Mla maintaining outer membrane lipid asymmetry ATPase subunit MlaF